ncbi:MAG: anti-sigma factor family protein [Pirellulaceae bacterium]
MRCDEFDVRLNQVLDRRRSPESDPELRHHAQVCLSCQDQLAMTRRLLDGLDMLDVPPLADDFALRVVSQVVPASPLPHRSSWFSWSVAVAALLLIGLLPGYWLVQQSTRPVATITPAPHAVDTQALAYSDPSASASGDRAVADDSLWAIYGNSLLELYPEATRERHRQQVSEIAADLRPIATPFNAAVTAIRRTIPLGRSPERIQPRTSLVPRPMSISIS